MAIQIEQGLFNLDFADYHAVLGVAIDADIKQIRKRYLKIARRLHPDSCLTESEAGKRQASELLSKLVNPAYKKLSQEKEFVEYGVMLRLKGEQIRKQQDTIQISSPVARELVTAGNVEHTYKTALNQLAEQQYKSLDQTLDITAQISELNLVYLMRQGSPNTALKTQQVKPAEVEGQPEEAQATGVKPSREKPRKELLVSRYLSRAKEFAGKNSFAKAIVELREALQIDPNHGECHSQLGLIYLKTNQITMAKIHFNKALQVNTEDQTAIAGMRRLGQAGQKAAKTQSKTSSMKGAEKPRGGLFGLFGGKKK
ncbi:MAG: DnaJ domain-containing protein [Cyanothece sp. SIO1E1]|nr:DnaJ domain-containing protein [Cyanothece sp. SIO1E1]